MEKVICENCGSIGYTASPRYVRCSDCGGSHRIIKDRRIGLRPLRLFPISPVKESYSAILLVIMWLRQHIVR